MSRYTSLVCVGMCGYVGLYPEASPSLLRAFLPLFFVFNSSTEAGSFAGKEKKTGEIEDEAKVDIFGGSGAGIVRYVQCARISPCDRFRVAEI